MLLLAYMSTQVRADVTVVALRDGLFDFLRERGDIEDIEQAIWKEFRTATMGSAAVVIDIRSAGTFDNLMLSVVWQLVRILVERHTRRGLCGGEEVRESWETYHLDPECPLHLTIEEAIEAVREAPTRPAFLIVLDNPFVNHAPVGTDSDQHLQLGKVIELAKSAISSGGSDSELSLDLPTRSHRHPHNRIDVGQGVWKVHLHEDATFIPANRSPKAVSPGGSISSRLHDGDRIDSGLFSFWFRLKLPGDSWLTPGVIGLVRSIAEGKQLDELPILADALEDAGCDETLILEHCRSGMQGPNKSWVAEYLVSRHRRLTR